MSVACYVYLCKAHLMILYLKFILSLYSENKSLGLLISTSGFHLFKVTYRICTIAVDVKNHSL